MRTRNGRPHRAGRWTAAILTASLVVILASPASAATHTGVWVGKTAQRDTIHLEVHDHETVVSLRIVTDVKARKCDVRITLTGTNLSVPIAADDTFRVKLAHGPATVVVKGAFTGPRAASGRFSSDYDGKCGSGHAKGTWAATRQ